MSEYIRIRALFPDHLGLARGKYLPVDLTKQGARFCITQFALTYDRTMTNAPGAYLLGGSPDCELHFERGEIRPCWEAYTGVVVGDLYFNHQPLTIAPRHVLHKAIADWKQLGYSAKVGIELEAFILQPDGRGGWTEWNTPGAYVYGTGLAVDPIGLMDEIWEKAYASHIPIEAINSEYDTPQFELTIRYDDVLRAVDNAFLFKVLARETAAKHGLLLTFMGKPFTDRGGSGFHINFSLQNDEGENVLVDRSAEDGLSTLARQCIAGLLAHHENMAALCASTVNAYKRLRPGSLAGYSATWGYDHRVATVRVPAERGEATRLEHRMSDGAANPYYATAVVLQAARLGVVNHLNPPLPLTGDGLETLNTSRTVPADLNLALNALEADTALVEAVGADAVAQFVAVKRFEWEKFINTVTDWELKFYLPFL